jgi:hypothetical protein
LLLALLSGMIRGHDPYRRHQRHPLGGGPVGGQYPRLGAAEAVVDAVIPVKGLRGRPGRPCKLHLEKGCDYPRCRHALRARGSTPRIARRGVESSQRLGRHRYVVARSLAWLVGYRRLQVRYERRADILTGFVYLACALVCLKWLIQPTG